MINATLLGHAGIILDDETTRLVFDPGCFSLLDDIDLADGIFITHSHADHMDVPYLTRKDIPVWAPADAIAQLRTAGVSDARLHVVNDGDRIAIGDLSISCTVRPHETIYPGLDVPSNASYLVDERVLVPGDSLGGIDEPDQVELLFLPLAGPWLKLSQAIDYAKLFPAATVVPIHDAILTQPGIAVCDHWLRTVIGERFSRRRPGEQLTL